MATSDRPNIILIITDQQRYDTIKALGYPYMDTPVLDALVREGTAFTQCFCTAPVCVPSRASLFNGYFPHSSGVYHNASRWTESWVTSLRDAGYHCVNVGKMHTVPYDAPVGFDQRFIVENKDRRLLLERPHGAFYDELYKFYHNNGVPKPTRARYKAEYPDYETALGAYEWALDERFHPDVFVGNMALWFLEQRASQAPLFLEIGFPGPHPPYDPPQRFIDRYAGANIPVPLVTDEELANQPPPHALYRQSMIEDNRDAVRWHVHPTAAQLHRLRSYYFANVTLLDEMIGRILDTLRRRGYLDNAVVVFCSDHGDCLGDHGHIQKWTMYDSATRVPLVLWSPGRVPAGRKVDALIQLMDLAPALFDLAGLHHDVPWEAESPLPLLTSDKGGRDHVFAELTADGILKGISFETMVRNREFKLVHYLDQECGELYDLRADPGETRNLWGVAEYETVKRRLLDVIRDWRIRSSLRVKPPISAEA